MTDQLKVFVVDDHQLFLAGVKSEFSGALELVGEARDVASAVEAAERLSGLKVRSAFVGISGSHIGSQNSRGMIAVSSRQHDVQREDTIRAIEAARAVSIPNTREILHVIPRGYVVDGQPYGDLTRGDILDNITLSWLTNTGVSSARLYTEFKGGFLHDLSISVPAAVSVFPEEIYQAPRSWAERAYSNLLYYKKHDKGGHFAAWEQPQLLAEDVRAGFRSLRAAQTRAA